MLAKEVIEDNLLSFMTQEVPNIETYGEPISQKVLDYFPVMKQAFTFQYK